MANGDSNDLLGVIREENAAAHQETRRHFEVVAEATRRDFEFATEETRRHFQVTSDELRRHFDLVTEAARSHVGLLAESVLAIRDDLTRTRDVLDARIERTAAETQAMIKFSRTDRDRRLTSLEQSHDELEQTVSDLDRRVRRIESKD